MACSACFSGGVSDNQPTGKEETIHGIPTYVAHPGEGVTPKGIIVFITDAFGWDFVNNRVLSDKYAKRGGFLVYCPDFMNGTSMSPKVLPLMDKILAPASWLTTLLYKPIYLIRALFMAVPWMVKCAPPKTHPGVVKYVQALRTSAPPFETKDLKIGAAGFCWGGKHTVLLAHDTASTRVTRHSSQTLSSAPEPLIDCAFTAHPSMLKYPDDIEAIQIPTAIAVGEEDMQMKRHQVQQTKEILESKKEAECEMNIIPGAQHGFAIRTHPEDEHEMECAERAEVQAIDWFTKWFT